MTYTEAQLEAIKLFGRKDLSFGCILRDKIVGTYCKYITENIGIWEGENDTDIQHRGFREERFEILGHIPHLFPDFARVVKENGYKLKTYYTNQGDYILNVYGIIGKYLEDYEIIYNPNLPLLDQPNLSDIISLFR